MLVMLAYDCPETRDQTFLRKEFEKLGAQRVQYSIYLFRGEPHECERVIRHMRRIAKFVEGDVRLLPMDEKVWEAQIVLKESDAAATRIRRLHESVVIW
ncbi:MAG: CRISPR-associated endonuclease Cas2 [Kiritimatiellae bacterium]|nr:CRISPR-associated endonuclease Cas2 [Kiritimatiellia bacterium]